MCGIIGYSGKTSAPKRLIEGLNALEYRGYDSAGVALFDPEGIIRTVKASGRIVNVEEKLKEMPELNDATCGIAHTRWATHGEPSDINSHPHGTESLSLVHNGIIENYRQIKKTLGADGCKFETGTDTEVAAKLLDHNYQASNREHELDGKSSDLSKPRQYSEIPQIVKLRAIKQTVNQLEGSFAFGIIFAGDPLHIYAVRNGSPLIVGIGEGENYIASDITAILAHTKRYLEIDKDEIAVISADEVVVYDHGFRAVQKSIATAAWEIEEAERGGYPHFMLKEINEEPDALIKTLSPRLYDGIPDFTGDGIDDEMLKGINKVYIVACGTAMHAGLYGKFMFEKLAKIPAYVEIASEFRYNDPIVGKGDLVIVISQSGETADSLAALRLAKEKGAYTLGIVNVIGSSISREAANTLYTWAGPEICVASTKAYVVQSALVALLAIHTAYVRETISKRVVVGHTHTLLNVVPDVIRKIIASAESIAEIARQFSYAENLFYIGRGCDYYVAMEGSLKLKEISYMHSETYPAGELKHGPIALITPGMPVIAIACQDALFDKMMSNIKEVKARGAKVLCLCHKGFDAQSESDFTFELPYIDELFGLLPAATVLQLFAYYNAVMKGNDVDKPRNLAKSVTVE